MQVFITSNNIFILIYPPVMRHLRPKFISNVGDKIKHFRNHTHCVQDIKYPVTWAVKHVVSGLRKWSALKWISAANTRDNDLEWKKLREQLY